MPRLLNTLLLSGQWMMLIVFCSMGCQAQKTMAVEKNRVEPFSIGESVELFSSILNEKRIINIYLPAEFSKDSSHKYPVIYLLDGSADEDFIHIAGLVQFGSFPWIEMLPSSIVVGIGNVDRRRDFTFPTKNEKDKMDFPTAGESLKFIDFLEKELQPFIQENYSGNETTTLIGQSLGGLLASEILFKKSAMFQNYIIVSPSLWWDDESLLDHPIQLDQSIQSIYLAVGKEGEVMERTAHTLHKNLKNRQLKSPNIYFKFYEGKDHGNILHLAVYDAFEKIFKQ